METFFLNFIKNDKKDKRKIGKKIKGKDKEKLNFKKVTLYFFFFFNYSTILTKGEISQNLVLLIQAEVELVLVLLLGHLDVQNTIKKK